MYKILNNILEMDDYSLQRLGKSSSVIEYIWYKLWGKTIQTLLPSEYQQVDYIESTGTQYIDTGIIPTNAGGTTVKFRFALNDITNGENQSIGANNNLNFYADTNTRYFRSNSVIISQFDNHWHDVEMSKSLNGKQTIFDGITYTNSSLSEESNSFCLFCVMASGTKYWGKYKLSYTKIYDNNKLVHHFIPCYRKSDNEVGMYDLVNNVFYTNDGTGSFTYGSVVPTPSNPVEVKGVGDRTGNLLPPPSQERSGTLNGITYYVHADGSVDLSGRATANVNIDINLSSEFTIPVSVSQGGSGTIAINNSFTNNASIILYYNSTIIDSWGFTVVNRTSTSYSAMANKTINKYSINIVSGTELSSGGKVGLAFSNNNTPVSPYEPYGYKIPIVCDNEIKNIYLSEPLHKINDYADILSYSEQGVVRKIKKLVLTGEESWTKSGNVYYITSIQPDYLRSVNITTICTHYQSVANAEAASAVNVGEIALFSKVGANQRLYIGDDRFANTTEFTAYLAQQYANGTPVTVWYVLDTEETEQIKAPDILANTYTSITVDTEVQPSQVDFTTKGKKVEPTNVSSRVSTLNTTNIDNTLGLDDTLNTDEFEPMEKEFDFEEEPIELNAKQEQTELTIEKEIKKEELEKLSIEDNT